MARVDDDRQMGQLRCSIGTAARSERVAGVVVKRADAALAEDDLLVAAGHDVFRAHQQLFDGVGQAALEQDGLVGLAKLLEQVKVLHIPRADLNHVDVLEQLADAAMPS